MPHKYFILKSIIHKKHSLMNVVTSLWRIGSPMSQKDAPKLTTATLFKLTKPIVLLTNQNSFIFIHLAELLGCTSDFDDYDDDDDDDYDDDDDDD